MAEAVLPGIGLLRLRGIGPDHERPEIDSPYEDWGPRDPRAEPAAIERWLIELVSETGEVAIVGDLSAHPVWYGPTAGSMAMNIGIGIVAPWRGRGLGTAAQRLLADLLHARGVHRVEASTDIGNVAEQHALASAGFRFEGVLLGAQRRADGRHDLQLWSHLGEVQP